MSNELDYDALSHDVVSLLQSYGLSPIDFGVACTLKGSDFEALANSHKMKQEVVDGRMILVRKGGQRQWFIQIMKEWEAPDPPPDAAPLHLPPNT